MINRASRQPKFQNLVRIAFEWLNQLKRRAIITKGRIQTRAEKKIDQVRERIHEGEYNDSAFDLVINDIRALVDEFAGAGSWDQWSNSTWNLFVELAHDEEASTYFDELEHYVLFAMEHPSSSTLRL